MIHQQVLGCFVAGVVVCCMIKPTSSKEWTKEEKEQITAAVKSCMESTKVDPNELETMKKNHSSMPESHEGKCFIKCMSEKMDGMKPDGTIDPVGTKAWLDENVSDQATREKMDAAIQECIAEEGNGNDACENAAKNVECMQQKFKDAGITSKMIMP